MIDSTKHYIIIGKFGRPYGIRGWISLYAESDHQENILRYQPWFISTKSGWQVIDINDCRSHHKNLIVHIQGIETPEEVRTFTDQKIAVLRDQLPALTQNEYYWADLEGLTVTNHENKTLGKITHLFRTGANDVIVVVGDKTRQLIPFIQKEIIEDIDLEHQTMKVNWDTEF